jgi:hypothetical protein
MGEQTSGPWQMMVKVSDDDDNEDINKNTAKTQIMYLVSWCLLYISSYSI